MRNYHPRVGERLLRGGKAASDSGRKVVSSAVVQRETTRVHDRRSKVVWCTLHVQYVRNIPATRRVRAALGKVCAAVERLWCAQPGCGGVLYATQPAREGVKESVVW